MSNKKIKFKRKESTGKPTSADGKLLTSGEPFYNTVDKHLYVGNSDTDTIDNKKHIAEVTVTQQDGGGINVSIGEDERNSINFDSAFSDDGEKIVLDLNEFILTGGDADDDLN
jgi:hypothetical protein